MSSFALPRSAHALAWTARLGLALLTLAAAFVLQPSPAKAQSDTEIDGARSFVTKLGDEAVSFLADRSLSQEQRVQRFEELFHDKFAVETIARFVAAGAWRTASAAQQQEYVDLFTRYVVNTYAQRLGSYSGQSLAVDSVRPVDNSILVSTEIVQPSGPGTRVDWRLRAEDGAFKILDVIIEGISMAITQRSEFASVIRSGGGGLDALIVALQRSRFTQ